MSLRIAIVCGHFIPDLGYFEVHFARACSRLGYSVRVITSVKVPSYVQGITFSTYSAGTVLTPAPAYTIQRLPAYFSAGQMVLSNGVKKAVKQFDPDLLFVIGLGKLFPGPIFELAAYNDRTFTLLGDNAHSFSNGAASTRLSQRFLKTPVYQKAIAHSKNLFAYTPSTEAIVAEQVGSVPAAILHKKLKATSLGFDEGTFFYNETLRQKERERLGLQESFTWVCVSRFSDNKDFSPFFSGLVEMKEKGKQFRVVFAGAHGKEAEALKRKLYDLSLLGSSIVLSFLEHEELNALYNAADAAWYPMAAISNFEGLGTGLPVLLPDDESVSHIIDGPQAGAYYSKDDIAVKMLAISADTVVRAEQAEAAKNRFEYKKLVTEILETARQ